MRDRILKHKHSFGYAWQGLRHAWTDEPNFSIHVVLSAVAILLGILLKISTVEFAIIILVISIGLATELANTAIESVTDLVTKEHRTEAKIAKDVGAGMMLVVSIGAILIAIVIYLPYITRLFS